MTRSTIGCVDSSAIKLLPVNQLSNVVRGSGYGDGSSSHYSEFQTEQTPVFLLLANLTDEEGRQHQQTMLSGGISKLSAEQSTKKQQTEHQHVQHHSEEQSTK